MDPLETDRLIRDLYERNSSPVDMDGLVTGVRQKLDAITISQEGSTPEHSWPLWPAKTAESSGRQSTMTPRPRTRRTRLRVALGASAAVVFVVALAFGSWQMAEHVGKGTPVVVVTDDTAGMSPGSTDQVATTSAPASASPQLLWKLWIGRIESPVTAVDGVIYVTGRGRYVYAVEAATGRELRQYEIVGGECSAPAIADGAMYVISSDGYLHAVELATGKEKWKALTGGAWDSSGLSPPAVSNGVIYINGPDGRVHALNAADGAEVWNFELGGTAYFNPTVADGLVYAGDGQRQTSYEQGQTWFYALDAATGKEKWRTPFAGVYSSVVADGVVYVTHKGGLWAGDAKTGQEIWNTDSWLGHADGHAPDNEVVSVNRGVSNPAVSDGVVAMLYSHDGYGPDSLIVFDARNGEQRWQLPDPAMGTQPNAAGGVLLVSRSGALQAHDVRTGEELWTFETGDGWAKSPVIFGGVAYLDVAGYLYAVDVP